MEIMKVEYPASIAIFTAQISESEIMAYEACISHVLKNLPDDEMVALTDHERDELEYRHENLLSAIFEHIDEDLLTDRLKRMKDDRENA